MIPGAIDIPIAVMFLAGVGQLLLVAGSLAIPRALRWNEQLDLLSPFMRRLFWVYAAYIAGTNLSFGLLSTLAPRLLIEPSPLAAAVAGFVAVYWFARLVIQFAVFDRNVKPKGPYFLLAEVALTFLFVFFAGAYGWLAVVQALAILA